MRWPDGLAGIEDIQDVLRAQTDKGTSFLPRLNTILGSAKSSNGISSSLSLIPGTAHLHVERPERLTRHFLPPDRILQASNVELRRTAGLKQRGTVVVFRHTTL